MGQFYVQERSVCHGCEGKGKEYNNDEEVYESFDCNSCDGLGYTIDYVLLSDALKELGIIKKKVHQSRSE